MKQINFNVKQDRGFALLEVVLAIAVFAFGMLALVELQTNLARSGSDANMRTVAANIAEELVERARGFTQLTAIADNNRWEYNEIVSYDGTEPPVPRAGLDYTVNLIVNDFYWDSVSKSFTETKPVGIINSDLKTMDIVVAWRPLETGESFDDHDSINFEEGGALRIVEVVPSQPSLLGALVSASKEADGGPNVDYNPGDNPDIVKLLLGTDEDGNKKFKEATSAAPIVIRADKVETWFDVVTYSQAGLDVASAFFLRREEFVAITCECILDTNPADAEQGLPPTLWDGATYTEKDKVYKPIGTTPNGVQQSNYCGVCCRDHHDGGGAADAKENVYNISRGDELVDHPHYGVNNQGALNADPAEKDGDRYIEACRLIRKDGFMRVTHDANQGALVGFPEGYLEFEDGATAYSGYVIRAIEDYYTGPPLGNYPDLEQPGLNEFPARNPDPLVKGTDLPTVFADSQQMRSRAVYTDYLTSAASDAIGDCFPTKTAACRAPTATSPLEMVPFFDLQMTWLARWTNEALNPSLMSLTNEPIEVGNRGIGALAGAAVNGAGLNDEGAGRQIAMITSNKGNLGLTATGAIDYNYEVVDKVTDNLYVDVNLSSNPVPANGNLVSGGLRSAVRRVDAAEIRIEPNNPDYVSCGQTDSAWKCVVAFVTTPGQRLLTVSNYYLGNVDMYACSELTKVGETSGDSGLTLTTTFQLPASMTPGDSLDIWVTDDVACPTL